MTASLLRILLASALAFAAGTATAADFAPDLDWIADREAPRPTARDARPAQAVPGMNPDLDWIPSAPPPETLRELYRAKAFSALKKGPHDADAGAASGGAVLLEAARQRQWAIAKSMIAGGVGAALVNSVGGTPLAWAVEDGESEMVRLFLDKGGDPFRLTPTGESLLAVAAARGHLPVVRQLLQAGVDADDGGRGDTPLHAAVRHGHAGVVALLLRRGADSARHDGAGMTPLGAAVAGHRLDCVKALLEGGAEPDLKDRDGRSPMHWAAIRKHWASARLLLDRGAEPLGLDFDSL